MINLIQSCHEWFYHEHIGKVIHFIDIYNRSWWETSIDEFIRDKVMNVKTALWVATDIHSEVAIFWKVYYMDAVVVISF